jgi:hypothetical protein
MRQLASRQIALAPAEIYRFFDTLNDASCAARRFIVLGRPEALSIVQRSRRWHVRTAEIRPFDSVMAQSWLQKWNASQPSRRTVSWETIEDANLAALTQTPVLLFMAAFALSEPACDPELERIS